MTSREFDRLIKSGQLHGGYFFVGPDDYTKKWFISKVCRAVVGDDEFSVIRIDGTDTSPAEISEAVSSFPMMSERKAVVVSPFFADSYKIDKRKNENALLPFAEAFGEAEMFSHTVLVVNIPSSSMGELTYGKDAFPAFYKTLEDFISPVYFEEETKSLRGWVEKGVRVPLADDAYDYLIGLCGEDHNILHGECSKLAAYAAAHGMPSVDAETVKRVCCETQSIAPFELQSAVRNCDRTALLEYIRKARDRRDEPIVIASAVASELCRMLSVKELLLAGHDTDSVCKIMKSKGAYYYVNSVKDIDIDELREVVLCLRDFDFLMKSGTDGFLVLERLAGMLPAR